MSKSARIAGGKGSRNLKILVDTSLVRGKAVTKLKLSMAFFLVLMNAPAYSADSMIRWTEVHSQELRAMQVQLFIDSYTELSSIEREIAIKQVCSAGEFDDSEVLDSLRKMSESSVKKNITFNDIDSERLLIASKDLAWSVFLQYGVYRAGYKEALNFSLDVLKDSEELKSLYCQVAGLL